MRREPAPSDLEWSTSCLGLFKRLVPRVKEIQDAPGALVALLLVANS